jgi:hypothetical protein
MAGRGHHIRRRGIGGRGPQVGGRGTAATLAPNSGSHGEAPATDRGRETLTPRGRGANPQPAQVAGADAPDRARGAGPGRGRGRVGGPRRGGAVDQPRRDRGDDTAANVVAPETVQAVEGGKGKHKRNMVCVICTDDHFTNQCPLLRGPKPSVAYCAASDDNGGFFHI